MHAVIGVLGDDVDPMVAVMKLEKAPKETYADIGGLTTQIQEIKVRLRHSKNTIYRFFLFEFKEAVELPLTHPEYYEEMGIKPPKGVILYGQPGTGKYSQFLLKSYFFIFNFRKNFISKSSS